MMAYFVFGDSNDEQGLRNLRMISIVSCRHLWHKVVNNEIWALCLSIQSNAHQLFRHGAKNPSGFYPLDPHATHDWQGGMGALTPVSNRYTIV